MAEKSDKAVKKDELKKKDEKLDIGLDETFPASDPPSMTEPTKHLGSGKKSGQRS